MLINIVINFAVRLIPFVSNLVDAAIKCNSKNVRLFKEHLDKTYKPRAQQDLDNALSVDRRLRPTIIYEDFLDDKLLLAYNSRNKRPLRVNSRRRGLLDEEIGLLRVNNKKGRRP
jgi:hypothetical protein